jgi:hypothetical protein
VTYKANTFRWADRTQKEIAASWKLSPNINYPIRGVTRVQQGRRLLVSSIAPF